MKKNSRETKRSARRNELGFTLIELMVVIVIIGMLAAIVAPKILGAQDKANVATAKAQISSLKSAVQMFKLEAQRYPGSLEELINNEYENFLDQEVIPLDPWKNPYIYQAPGQNGREFEIVSYGADGQQGGEDYNADIVSWNLQGE